MLALRYEFDRATIYSGWEYILFRNPSDSYPDGFTAIGIYPVPAGYVNATAYTENKILRSSGPASNTPFATTSTSPALTITITRTTTIRAPAPTGGFQTRAAAAPSMRFPR